MAAIQMRRAITIASAHQHVYVLAPARPVSMGPRDTATMTASAYGLCCSSNCAHGGAACGLRQILSEHAAAHEFKCSFDRMCTNQADWSHASMPAPGKLAVCFIQAWHEAQSHKLARCCCRTPVQEAGVLA